MTLKETRFFFENEGGILARVASRGLDGNKNSSASGSILKRLELFKEFKFKHFMSLVRFIRSSDRENILSLITFLIKPTQDYLLNKGGKYLRNLSKVQLKEYEEELLFVLDLLPEKDFLYRQSVRNYFLPIYYDESLFEKLPRSLDSLCYDYILSVKPKWLRKRTVREPIKEYFMYSNFLFSSEKLELVKQYYLDNEEVISKSIYNTDNLKYKLKVRNKMGIPQTLSMVSKELEYLKFNESDPSGGLAPYYLSTSVSIISEFFKSFEFSKENCNEELPEETKLLILRLENSSFRDKLFTAYSKYCRDRNTFLKSISKE